jgi:hypothetical protein
MAIWFVIYERQRKKRDYSSRFLFYLSAFLESWIPQVSSNVDGFLWIRALEIFFFRIVVFILLLYNKSIAILPLVIKKGGRVDGQKGF